MPCPDLPVDVIILISKFLAGSHAFGSLASLHLANHNVREATLPVLYETVLLDNPKPKPHRNGPSSSRGLRSTRYLFIKEGRGLPSHDAPELLATIHLPRNTTQSDRPMYIWIHKPVKSSALFGVIASTPVHHRKLDHAKCIARSRNFGVWSSTPSLCAFDTMKPLVRAMQRVEHIMLEDGAYLIGRNVGDEWSTRVRLAKTDFSLIIDVASPPTIFSTVFELLRLPGRQPYRGYLRTIEGQELHRYKFGHCEFKPNHPDYHIDFKVTPLGCVAFIEKFRQEVALHPDILLNRICVAVQSGARPTDMVELVESLLPIYERYAPSESSLLPTAGAVYTLFTLDYFHDKSQKPGVIPGMSGLQGVTSTSVCCEVYQGRMRYHKSTEVWA